MNAIVLTNVKAYIDISEWWLKDSNGEPLSVYAVHKMIEDNYPHLSVTRHTLTRARDGQLEKFDAVNAVKLARLCSKWAGKVLRIDDLIKVEED
ncbi:hypothetical protein [Pantanalinema sp. GBBB05]|uniref:hypothetical protein n=1 Tax=Pantanalinema sp. GBBB05 TaxID=2604139 RepID=UPI001D4869AC|nr:hypothetical protein [Pantanalinema sp. GBBB05]